MGEDLMHELLVADLDWLLAHRTDPPTELLATSEGVQTVSRWATTHIAVRTEQGRLGEQTFDLNLEVGQVAIRVFAFVDKDLVALLDSVLNEGFSLFVVLERQHYITRHQSDQLGLTTA